MSGKYQVWCDVGGTFTDCFVTDPLGQRQRLKVLSHGRMPGHIDRWCDPNAWIDARCVGQPEGFWASCRVVLFDADRQAVAQASVRNSMDRPDDSSCRIGKSLAVTTLVGRACNWLIRW